MIFKIAKNLEIFGLLLLEKCFQDLSNITQSGHTGLKYTFIKQFSMFKGGSNKLATVRAHEHW